MTRLSLEGLTLARGSRLLIENLTAAFEPGALVELTGPNGSGKTTLLRAIAGFVRPMAGAIRLGEATDAEDRATALHLLGHRDGLKGALSLKDHVRYWADLFAGRGSNTEDALAEVGLKGFAELPARVLSQGQSRRLALTRLLVAPRPVWLLDEPAAGLDKAGKQLLIDLIDRNTAQGGLVVAAVHEPIGRPALSLALESLKP
jgi:heme exporter protein A